MMKEYSLPRWLMTALGLAVVAALAGGAWFYRAQEQHLRQSAEAGLQAIAQLKVDQIAQWRAERLADAAVIAESPFFAEGAARSLAAPQAENTEQMLTQFRSIREHYHYRDVLLVDAGGQVRLSLSGRSGPLHAEEILPLAEALRERRPVLTDLHAGPGDTPPHLGSVAPLFAPNGAAAEPLGAVVLQADARQFLYPLTQSWPVPSRSAETLLVRRDGDAVLFLNDLRYQEGAALTLRIPLSREDVPAVMAVQGQTGIVQGKDYRGVEVLSALKAVPNSPWFMVAKVDAEEVFSVWRSRSVLILALILVFVAAAAATAGVIWQRDKQAHYRALVHEQAALRESEARLRTLVASIPQKVFMKGRDCKYVSINDSFARDLGVRPEEVVGKVDRDFFPKDLADKYRADDERIMSTGVADELDEEYVEGNERRIVHTVKAPVRDENGEIVGLLGIFHDITERKRAEEALGRSERNLRGILEAARDGIVAADVETRKFVVVNEAACRMLGYNRNELLGLGVEDIHPAEDLPHVVQQFERQTKGEISLSGDLPVKRKDGSVFHADVNTALVELGGRACLLGIFRDTTQRREAEEKLRSSFAEVARFNRLAVGRELRMIELKREVNAMAAKAGLKPPYNLAFAQAAATTDAPGRAAAAPAHTRDQGACHTEYTATQKRGQ